MAQRNCAKYPSAKLNVPEANIDAYRSHDVWSKFGSVSAGIEDAESDAAQGFDPTSSYEVYNLEGKYMRDDLEQLQSGFYIVRQNGNAYKILR